MSQLAHPDRIAKLEALRAQGIDPFPARGVASTPIDEILVGLGTAASPGPRSGQRATIAGRLFNLRDFGKLVFAPVADRSGRLQVGFQQEHLAQWWPTRKLLDAGDIVGVTGELGFTKKGEPTLWAHAVTLLSKAVAPPPEKWHGLVDKELRYRRRYVDLWSSEGVADVFVKRAQVLSTIRKYLEGEGYLEVETPTLHPIAGGAAARPFVTHHNALDMDFFLRIAPELYLKRLIVGGLERVFEIARNFRNEGLSARHNPEFTMLELYEAQADYTRMMEIAEQVIVRSALAATGATALVWRGRDYDLHAPFPRASYVELFRQKNGFEFDDAARVARRAAELGLVPPKTGSQSERWRLMNDVFEATVEDDLEGPVLVVDYPVQISPLAKQKPGDPRLAERFEVFVAGMEIGNAFTELNDPFEQARRFQEQVSSLDPEAPGQVDWDYVQALEYGMPPAGGLGIGVDRLVMILTGQESIRDVLLFPAMKPQAEEAGGEAEDAAEVAAAKKEQTA